MLVDVVDVVGCISMCFWCCSLSLIVVDVWSWWHLFLLRVLFATAVDVGVVAVAVYCVDVVTLVVARVVVVAELVCDVVCCSGSCCCGCCSCCG